MTVKIISAIIILITVFFSFKHGWPAATMTMKPETIKMFSELGIEKKLSMMMGVLLLLVGVLVLFPPTFFIGNFINAALILFIIAMALRAGVTKVVLIEIPFLLIPLVSIWLGHPLKK